MDKAHSDMKTFQLLVVIAAAIVLSGCSARYITPGGHANLKEISNPALRQSFASKPAAGFPAGIATVRVQESKYNNYHLDREGGVYGRGRYSVVLMREVEDESDINRLRALPQVGGIISLSRLLLPEKLDSDQDLREAAARLKADMLLLYTFDTSFRKDDNTALTVVSWGLSQTRKVTARVQASALLLDTRTGFIYGAFESAEKKDLTTNAWKSEEDADRARRDLEQATFKKLVTEFEKGWPEVVERAKKGA
jgi:hypothetical protein